MMNWNLKCTIESIFCIKCKYICILKRTRAIKPLCETKNSGQPERWINITADEKIQQTHSSHLFWKVIHIETAVTLLIEWHTGYKKQKNKSILSKCISKNKCFPFYTKCMEWGTVQSMASGPIKKIDQEMTE